MGLLNSFRQYIEANRLVGDDDRILLTVSGGVDSMVMLTLFVECGYSVGVAHCNFQLRGEESDEDAILVEKTAQRYGLAHYSKRFDTTEEIERSGESMEMVARRLRYEWFNTLCQEHNYTSIAVAHHADDSIETFFINLLRGTGLRGLTGISSQVGKVVRPLTFASRKEILEYAVANHIKFREDSSNRSTKYLRNKIRLGLIPRIKEIKPKFSALMGENISHLTNAQIFIDQAIELIKERVVESQGGIDTIFVDRIDAHLPLQFVIYQLLNSQYGFKGDVITKLYNALVDSSQGKRFYSRDYVAYIDRGNVVVTRIEEGDSCEIEVVDGTLRSYCGNSVLLYESIDIDLLESFNAPENIALLDANKLTFPLTLRRWSEGDSFIPFGMQGHKKVSDYLIDDKVSLPEKGRQFVLVSGSEIVWLVGRRIDDRYRITDSTESVLRITKEII